MGRQKPGVRPGTTTRHSGIRGMRATPIRAAFLPLASGLRTSSGVSTADSLGFRATSACLCGSSSFEGRPWDPQSRLELSDPVSPPLSRAWLCASQGPASSSEQPAVQSRELSPEREPPLELEAT